jgi:uncharacterized coiled-coil DUF342 family protein
MLSVANVYVTLLTGAGVVVGLVLLAGILAGQFRRGVVEELRSTLETAKNEIEIERGRSDRLEREAMSLRNEVSGLRSEVATLRSVMLDDRKLAKSIAAELAITRQHEIEEIKEAIGHGTALVLEAVQRGK